jgi:predicted nucleic-acid-binding protein
MQRSLNRIASLIASQPKKNLFNCFTAKTTKPKISDELEQNPLYPDDAKIAAIIKEIDDKEDASLPYRCAKYLVDGETKSSLDIDLLTAFFGLTEESGKPLKEVFQIDELLRKASDPDAFYHKAVLYLIDRGASVLSSKGKPLVLDIIRHRSDKYIPEYGNQMALILEALLRRLESVADVEQESYIETFIKTLLEDDKFIVRDGSSGGNQIADYAAKAFGADCHLVHAFEMHGVEARVRTSAEQARKAPAIAVTPSRRDSNVIGLCASGSFASSPATILLCTPGTAKPSSLEFFPHS